MKVTAAEQIREGIKEAKRGNTNLGRILLQNFACCNDIPEARAWYGYCLAKDHRDFGTGIRMCLEVLNNNPKSADCYLALSRIYLVAGRRKKAIEVLHQGARIDSNQEILKLMKSIGIRKPQVFSRLGRDHVFNVLCGRLLAKMGLR